MIWAVFSFLVLLFAHLGGLKGEDSRITIFYRVCLVLVLSVMTGLGSVVGTDHYEYVLMYNGMQGFSLDVDFISWFEQYSVEPGFQFLLFLGKTLHLSEPLFFFALAVIMNSLFVAVLYRYPFPEIAILALILASIFAQEANILRQVLAVSVVVYSVKYLDNRKPLWFITGVIIAMSFHTSALVCILLLLTLLVKKKESNQVYFWTFLSIWIISIFAVIGLRIPVFESISSLLINSRYSNHFVENANLGYGAYQFNYFYNSLMILALFAMRNRPRIEFIIIAVGCILQNFSAQVAPLIRISLYFTTMMPLAIGMILSPNNYEKQNRSFIVYARYLVFAFYIYTLISKYILGDPILGSKFY